jgi:CRISPR-associated protein (TIGR02710 family)
MLLEISLTDAPHNYDVLRKIVKSNPDRKVVVDISGGVKVMGTSLATAAFWLRLPVIYQLGEEVQGIVRPFSEHLTRLVNPYLHFGSTDLRSIQELFHAGNYDAALTLASNLREAIGDVTTLGRLDILIEFMSVYRDWDAFRHSALGESQERRLATRLRNINEKMRRMGVHFANPALIEANLEFLNALEDTWQPDQRSHNDKYRVVDIFAAAQRRAAAGKYDDATGRLYRCLEMSASICLAANCSVLNPQKPDLQFFVRKFGSFDSFSKKFQERARYPLAENRGLGLKDQMVLLEISEQQPLLQIADIYRGMENRQLLEKRNRSILAHGTVSVTKEEFDQYSKGTHDIVSRTVGTPEMFNKLLNQASHPIVRIEL